MIVSSKKVAPLQDFYGNLHFSPSGVFAYWIVTPPDKPLANARGLAAAAAAHRAFTDLLPLRPALEGTSVLKSPRFIYEQQARYADTRRFPLFEQICRGREREAAATAPRYPVFWLYVRLEPPMSGLNVFGAAHRRLVRAGMVAPRATEQTLAEYWELMQSVEARIPAVFAPVRPTGAQLRWFHRRQHTLGVVDEPLPLPEDSDAALVGYRWAPRVELVEGDRSVAGVSRPLLKVTSIDDGTRETYQIRAAVTSFPAGGIYFPGSNFTSVISDLYDELGQTRLQVDWSQRAHQLPLSRANRRNAAGFRKLNEQYGQQVGRRSTAQLDESEAALADFEYELSANPREAEVVFTTVFSIGAPTAEEAHQAYGRLRETLEELRVETAAPAGQQIRLYQSTRPGVEDLSIQSSFAQYTTRTGWSRFIPMVTRRFGDHGGRAVGLNRMSADLDFVNINFRGHGRQVMGGGMIVGGDPRTGKTHFTMLNAAEEAAAGACVVMFDATHGQHWRRFAQAVPNSAAINLAEGRATADPLILIGGVRGAELLVDELCRIASITDASTVAELRLLVTDHAWPSTANLLDYLTSTSCPPALAGIGRQLLGWASTPTGQALFGRKDASGSRVPLPTLAVDDVSLLVVETQDLDLPTEEEVRAAASGGTALTPRQMIGQSVMALFALYLRKVFYSRKSFDILGFDEGWRTVSMKILKDLVFEIFRTGPAANVDVWMISQKPWRDFPGLDDDLARVRAVFTVKDPREAAEAAQWCGVDPQAYPELVEALSTGLSPRSRVRDAFHRARDTEVVPRDRMGECLLRIGEDDVGWVKTFEMVFSEWEQAADTRPAML